MGKLKVVDLTKMQLSSLPSSLHFLENLQTLCLDQYVLGDIAVIGKLKNLAILSLLDSKISQLPREIGLLSHLHLLDLSNYSKLEVIPANVLSRLEALEELYMETVLLGGEGRNNASLAELKGLSHLITLEMQIPNANILPKDLLFEKLQRYVISVGVEWDWFDVVGSRVNLIRAQRTLAGLEAQKTLQAQHLRGIKTGDSNSKPPRPPGLRISNSRLPVRDLLRRQRARIRGLRDLRVLGPRIRGPMPET
jgi:hypothetical protein